MIAPKSNLEHETIANLEVYGLPYRTIGLLDSSGLLWLRQLEGWTEKDLLDLPNMGMARVRELKMAIQNYVVSHKVKTIEECIAGI